MGLDLLNRFLVDLFENQRTILFVLSGLLQKYLSSVAAHTYTPSGHVCSLSTINYVWSIGYRLLLLEVQIIRCFVRLLLAVVSVLGSNMFNI
jgi:hypothetical protein